MSVTFLTLITFVGSFTSMSSLVANKIRFPTKSFFTLQTLKQFPTRVRSVPDEVCTSAEAFVTLTTQIQFLARMASLVDKQIRALTKILATDITCIEFFTCMRSLVS